MNKRWNLIRNILIGFFAIIGFLFFCVFIAMQFGILNVRGSIDERNKFFTENSGTIGKKDTTPTKNTAKINYPWVSSPEWLVLTEAFKKDTETITKASIMTDVPARLIVAVAVPEQFRFFTSNRESYKKYFEPLKILGTMSQFSLGVTGIKPETAQQIEKNLVDKTSPFYLGYQYEHALDYAPTANHDTELYNRLTDPHDHYYQYLYTALFIKQIEMQWQNAGFKLENRPDVISTLFNLGFKHSVPNSYPTAGGAPLTIGDEVTSFGTLSYEFYFSGELLDVFPN